MAESTLSIQGFRAERGGVWQVTAWTKGMVKLVVDPYFWKTENEAQARVHEYMAAKAHSSSWGELYKNKAGELCEFKDLGVGAFLVVENPPGNLGLRMNLPGDCSPDYIPIVRGPATGTGHDPWGWDGNYDAPTLVPSIHAKGIWHGFLEKGFFRSC